MKRILIFSVAYLPFIGGAEIAVKEITDRIPDVEFDLITLNLDQQQLAVEKIGNVTVYRFGRESFLSKLLYPFRAFFLATKLHYARRYNATWSIMASFSGFAALLFKLSHRRIPFLLTLQEGDPLESILKKVWFIKPIFRMIFTEADHIQAISNFLARWARQMWAKAPISIIPNGVDISLFSRLFSAEEKQAVRQSLGIVTDETVLITTSRLIQKNGIADVIEAMTLLPKTTRFLIVGVGPLEVELKQQVERHSLQTRVQFCGLVEYKKIPEYLAAANIFIRPSHSEGMGNSFVEAMAAGLPVIGTAVGGLPDFLHHEKTGVVVPVADPAAIAKAVERLLSDQALREGIVDRAKTMVLARYDWQNIAHEINEACFKPLFE